LTGYTYFKFTKRHEITIRSDGQELEASPKLEDYNSRQVMESQRIVLLWNSHRWPSCSLGEVQSNASALPRFPLVSCRRL